MNKNLKGIDHILEKNLECDEWCEPSTRFNIPWKGGSLGLITYNNGHHRKSKFDNEDKHCHLHINIFQTFLVWLHE